MLWKENNDKRPCLTFKISSLGFISRCLFVRQHWSLPVITIMENCSLLEMMAVLNRDSPPQTAPAATTSQGKAMSLSKQARTQKIWILGFWKPVFCSVSHFFCAFILNPNYCFLFEEHLKWRFCSILVAYLLRCTALLSFAMIAMK